MTRAVVADVALNASATLYALASFPGAAGSAWPPEFATAVSSPAGSVTQDGAGYGVLQANNASAWNASTPSAIHKSVSSVNLELSGRFRTPGNNGYVPQFWPQIGLGIATTPGFAADGQFSTGVTLVTALGNGTWSVADPAGNLSGNITNPSGGTAWVPLTVYGYRFRRTVSAGVATVSARLWLWSQAEPTAWGYQGTTTNAAAITAGSFGYVTGQGGDTEARPIAHTGLLVTDGT